MYTKIDTTQSVSSISKAQLAEIVSVSDTNIEVLESSRSTKITHTRECIIGQTNTLQDISEKRQQLK